MENNNYNFDETPRQDDFDASDRDRAAMLEEFKEFPELQNFPLDGGMV